MNPADAERLALSDGGTAKITARAGSVTAPIVVSDEMMPGVVSLPHGFGCGLSDCRSGPRGRDDDTDCKQGMSILHECLQRHWPKWSEPTEVYTDHV